MDTNYTHNPIQSPKTLKQRIMRRIYFVFMVRNFSPVAFDCFLIVFVVFVTTLFVSVKDVFENLSTAQSSGNLSNFSFSAFSSTELQTKLLLVVLGVIGFFTVRHLKRAVQAVRMLRQEETDSKRQSPNSKS